LGNVRLVFTESNGLASIVQENHYYPFGMQQNGNWAKTQTVKNDYLYNGKELNTEIGLNWIDYGARFYNTAIGRFTSPDPLAEFAPEWTPYRYGFNNPISYIDPDGLFESKKEAKEHAKNENIKTGFLRKNKIVKNKDGSYSIDNKKGGSTTFRDSGSGEVIKTALVVDSKPQSTSSQIMSGTMAAALVTSQLDSPILGPEDAVALLEILLGTSAAGLAYITVDQITTTIADPYVYTKKATDSSKNEKHGDNGRTVEKTQKQIDELTRQAQNATGGLKKQLNQKIKNIRKNAANKRKGTEDTRSGKRN